MERERDVKLLTVPVPVMISLISLDDHEPLRQRWSAHATPRSFRSAIDERRDSSGLRPGRLATRLALGNPVHRALSHMYTVHAEDAMGQRTLFGLLGHL